MREVTNKTRASWAFEALSAFGQATAGDWKKSLGFETAMSDLLADLMHLADRHKLSWATLVDKAEYDYEEEIREEKIPVTPNQQKRKKRHGHQVDRR
jgi:hypothetical protein